ncbi:MAG: 2-C-methyl-D-erythritol 2,4-cyclodiphosphate synthase [Gemmatimonadetes bacterium]|nr:MAG: 2-C-methyl-D-erythritol 2,4-cyclodiphosphate synthase [Gemmatimonadota bacterium]
MIRIGFGYDVHAFASERPLILGGCTIPHSHGLQGHSDADVLLHAICDALFGALALGDIGTHFPDTDPQYKGIDSGLLLQKCYRIVREHGYQLGNVDVTVAAQTPKLAPYIPHIRENVARLMEVSTSQISVKATTTEKLGFVGEKKGIAAYAVVLIQLANPERE